MLIRNVPIRCRGCNATVHGQAQPVTESSGRKVMNCVWRCGACGSVTRQGVTRVISEPPTNK